MVPVPGSQDESTRGAKKILQINADDVLQLIGAHLTEHGLHQTARMLRRESRVGLAGSFATQYLPHWARTGQWDLVVEALEALDDSVSSCKSIKTQAYEMAILELADQGEWELAHATFRLVHNQLHGEKQVVTSKSADAQLTLGRLLEQKLAALAASRQKDPDSTVTGDYYHGLSRQERREVIAVELEENVPHHPRNRLLSLLQQSVQWQSHTGILPEVKERYCKNEDSDDGINGNETKRSKKRRRRKFNLVLGEVKADAIAVDELDFHSDSTFVEEPIPTGIFSVISFGKKATAEAAVFLPDGSGLVSGSSDGLIEVWDARQQFAKLNTTDLEYQRNENLLGHDGTAVSALAVANDGKLLASAAQDGSVSIWNLSTGKCLRNWKSGNGAVIDLALTPDSGRILVASGRVVREFGLRSARMTQEFRGHDSYVTCCHYVANTDAVDNDCVEVVTGSGDGTVRWWNMHSGDLMRTIRPLAKAKIGDSLLVNSSTDATDSPAVHTVLPLEARRCVLVVSRSRSGFLLDRQGIVKQKFSSPSEKQVFVAATTSPSQHTVYAVQDDGICCIFSADTGELIQSLDTFGQESTRKKGGNAEISSLAFHPNKHIVAGFSNDKGQKKGEIALWK